MALGRDAEAESLWLRAIDLARSQDAKELRAAMDLAGLWQAQGKKTKARDILTAVYNWFTEGFDTLDLKDAKALLVELA